MLRFLLLSILAVSATGLRAESFTIEGAVARARRSNPDLAAARWSIEEARGRLRGAGRPSNPEFELELKPNLEGREGSVSVGFSQKFPLTKRLYIEQAISLKGLALAEAEVRNAERLLAAEVRTAAVKYLAARASMALTERQRKLALDQAEDAEKIEKTGEGSPLEAAHNRLHAQQMSLELLKGEAERTTLSSTLRPLLGIRGKETVIITGELSPPSSSRSGASPEKRADYQAAIAKEAAARTAIELARAGKWEDASFGLSAELDRGTDVPEGRRTESFVGFKFTIPFPFWNKNEGKIQESTAAAERAAREVEALARRIRAEAVAAQEEMDAAAKIAGETSSALLKSAVSLEEQVVKASATGQATYADVLRAREKRFTIEADRLAALRDYHLARVRLMAAQGR